MTEHRVKPYLDYLDKEMTIMGILSTFSVLVPAVVIERTASSPDGAFLHSIWDSGHSYLWLASILMLVAASLFYSQRSRLAWHYGQTIISITIPGHNGAGWKQWGKDADSWQTWRPYDMAFTALRSAFYGYGASIMVATDQSLVGIPPSVSLWIVTASEAAFLGVRLVAKTKHKYEDHPMRQLLAKSVRSPEILSS